ncbi:hypothetical protein [Seonamhaeicola marinus]|uniref:Gliding motility-associated protein GldM N-terminal domain-containing protein n=1 Tax=Seonamhaeicola marinus TaxID=1912246 RepID=A0A5D0HZN2_9FLAO|nr:hypothetical protein [Seonamhaeicola marinus]TYA74972.1 hypothetical protein FUA24_16870 [Seonamhaeicola marinus]
MSKKNIYILIVVLFFVGAYFIWSLMQRLNNEVTTTFSVINERLEMANAQSYNELDSLYIAASQTKFGSKTDSLRVLSFELDNYIESLKLILVESISDPQDYETMDDANTLDSLFFKETGYTPTGQEFITKIETYETTVKHLFSKDFDNIDGSLNNMFYRNQDQDDWLSYHFKGFPLVASLTKLTQIQADLVVVEEGILYAIHNIE